MPKLDDSMVLGTGAADAPRTKLADPDAAVPRPGLRDGEAGALAAELTRAAAADNADNVAPKPSAESPVRAPSATPGPYETLVGLLALGAWVCFFGAGILVSTKPLRDALWGGAPLSFFTRVGYLLVTVGCYTVTNLFFLACLSSFLGCMACRWQVTVPGGAAAAGGKAVDAGADFFPHVAGRRLYAAALLRGFLLYTFAISGLLVMSTEASIIDTNPAQYVRLAGFVSAVAFIVGYDPQLINRFISKVNDVGNLPLGRKGP